jgi:hypothetical protein
VIKSRISQSSSAINFFDLELTQGNPVNYQGTFAVPAGNTILFFNQIIFTPTHPA